jgi:hypothetical protein
MKTEGITYQQGMRVFASFDLVGSSSLKLRQPPIDWLSIILDFFERTKVLLQEQLDEQWESMGIARAQFDIWRVVGDEILFVSGRLEDEAQVMVIARAVDTVLDSMDRSMLQMHGLGTKATIWMAGFPIRNKELQISPQTPYEIRASTIDLNERELRAKSADCGGSMPMLRDFLGSEIDLGFRLSALAQPRRLAASLEVVYFLALKSVYYPKCTCKYFLVGWHRLKGVYGEIPYPIFWLHYGKQDPEKRVSYEEELSQFSKSFFGTKCSLSAKEVIELEERYRNETHGFRIRPYLTILDQRPESHTEALRRASLIPEGS